MRQPELGVSDLSLGSRCRICDIRLAYRALMVVSSHSALTVSVYPVVLSGVEKSPSQMFGHLWCSCHFLLQLGAFLCAPAMQCLFASCPWRVVDE